MYLPDANVFITANRDYYPLDRVPEFWSWLVHHANEGDIKVPKVIWDEITPHDEMLKAWQREHQDVFVLKDDGSDILVPTILAAYGDRLTETELEKIGKDPFLIACGLHLGATVVSKEGTRPGAQRANRRIPDICRDLGVDHVNDHKLIRELDFSTKWNE